LQASGQNSDITIGFSDPDLLRSDDVFRYFFTVQIKNVPYSVPGLFDREHVSHAVLLSGMICTKFEFGRPLHSRLTTFLLLIRYVTLWPWPLTWTSVMYWLSYSDFKIEKFGAVYHPGYDPKW